MDTVDFARVVAEFGPSSALLVEPGSSAAAHVPPRWAGIAGGGDPRARRAAAVALWNLDMFADLLPRFGAVLEECLDDVRVCLLRGDWVLLYALRKPFQAHEFRIGWDPETFGADQPPYWDALPESLRVFLGTVHAGFTDLDGISFGPTRPRDMRTYHALNLDEPVRNWEAAEDIPGDRAMLIAKGLGETRYFVSPDLPGGTLGWEADGHLDRPLDFAQTFDELMSYGFQLERDRPPAAAAPVESPTPQELRQASMSVPRAARAVVWNRELTEDIARDRIRDLVAELLDALDGQMRIRPQDGPNGETILPFDDDAGNIYQVDRLETRYFLDPPAPDRADIYPPVIVRIWEQRGWTVTLSTDAEGILAHARTSDRYELTLTHRDDTLRLSVASPGFHRPH
ncbi:hypothetical protein LTT66_30600 [Nocardia gipuzkoensis]|uniref:hypothetical protein n=1 Tax=Nocardia gipuzkoensis TaxID=2749991 RepID=UPI001E506CC9|nr:hypothetical protein [Nocardia gipuzkoensis]UGT67519.1 hypothetical protein LTT66_30600 [Nocardia gipuzkoensis]